MKAIRVGIIRCDMHAIYYAALMDKHDAMLLADPDMIRPEKRNYSWLTGGAHFYFYTHYSNPRRMTVPSVKGFRITKLWEPDREIAETASKIFYGRPKVCDSFEEVSDDVDMVYVADCNGDGSDHLKLATPGIKKRVPHFIDKPFAYDVKDAVALVRLAKKHRTPIVSLSILRTVPQGAMFRKRADEVGGVHFGTIKGGGINMAGQIHAISLAQQVFGNGVESVAAMGKKGPSHILLDYGDKGGRPPSGVVLLGDSGPSPHCALYVSAYGPEGAIHSPQIGDWVFPWGAARNLELAKEMVRAGKPVVPYDDMIENIAVATAARKAHKLGRVVKLSEVWKRKR